MKNIFCVVTLFRTRKVPAALAEAFRQGHMGVMDYVRYNNVQSDTEMRKSIATGDEEDTEPLA